MSLIKGAGVLSVASAISGAIMPMGVIVQNRLYSPEECGIYAVILGLITIQGLASSFRYEMTIYRHFRRGFFSSPEPAAVDQCSR